MAALRDLRRVGQFWLGLGEEFERLEFLLGKAQLMLRDESVGR